MKNCNNTPRGAKSSKDTTISPEPKTKIKNFPKNIRITNSTVTIFSPFIHNLNDLKLKFKFTKEK